MNREQRIEADRAAGIPTKTIVNGPTREVVVDIAEIALRRTRLMSLDEVVSTIAADYCIRLHFDAAGQVVIEPGLWPGTAQVVPTLDGIRASVSPTNPKRLDVEARFSVRTPMLVFGTIIEEPWIEPGIEPTDAEEDTDESPEI